MTNTDAALGPGRAAKAASDPVGEQEGRIQDAYARLLQQVAKGAEVNLRTGFDIEDGLPVITSIRHQPPERVLYVRPKAKEESDDGKQS